MDPYFKEERMRSWIGPVAVTLGMMGVFTIGLCRNLARENYRLTSQVFELHNSVLVLKAQVGDYSGLPDDAIYSADGKLAAVFDGNVVNDGNSCIVVGTVSVCDVRHRKIVRALKKQDGLPLCFSPDGNFLLIGHDVYDWRNQKVVKKFNFPGMPVSATWKGDIITIKGISLGGDGEDSRPIRKVFRFKPAKPKPQPSPPAGEKLYCPMARAIQDRHHPFGAVAVSSFQNPLYNVIVLNNWRVNE